METLCVCYILQQTPRALELRFLPSPCRWVLSDADASRMDSWRRLGVAVAGAMGCGLRLRPCIASNVSTHGLWEPSDIYSTTAGAAVYFPVGAWRR